MTLTQISTGGVKNDAVTAGKIPANAVGSSEIADDAVGAAQIADDGVAQAAVADEAIDEARLQISNAGSNGQFLSKQSGNTGGLTWADVPAQYTHPNHSGEVTSTGDGATVIASNIVDEDNLKISNAGTNGQFLSKQSGDTGGLTWATVESAPSFTATATGAITAEDGVIMQADGKVAKIFANTTATGSQTNIDSSSSAFISAYDKVSGKIAYLFRNGSACNVMVGTISGTTITFGSDPEVSSASADNFGLAFNNNTLMVGYRRDNVMRSRACTVSGTSITVGSETTIQATNVSGWGSTVVYDSTSDRWVIFYMTSTGGRYKVCSISGTTITQGTEGEAASTHYRGVKAVEAKSKGRILLAWLWNSGNTEGLMRVGQVNGGSTNTITWGAETDISQEGGSEVMKKIAVGWDDKNDQGLFGFVRASNYLKVRAFEIDTSDNSIDQGSVSGVTGDVTPYLDIVWNPDASQWRIIFIKDGSGDNGKIQDKPCTVSSALAPTVSNGEEYGPDVYSSGVFAQGGGRLAEYIGDSGILSAWRDNASGSASREYRIKRYGGGNMSSTEPFIGFAAGTVSDGQTCTVKVVGNTATKSSLTPGRDYYVQSDGSVSIGTEGTHKAGIAISTTKILIGG